MGRSRRAAFALQGACWRAWSAGGAQLTPTHRCDPNRFRLRPICAGPVPSTVDGKQIDAAADREIAFPLGGGHTGRMQGGDYLNHYVLPNFYFHVTAAYAILRHCGVEVGKRDFLGAIPIKRT
jgi:hypothetical protein